MKEARKARYSVLREFAFGTEHGMAAAHATLLRGAAAVEELEVDEGVADSQLGEDAREARAAARAAVQAAEALLGPDRDRLRASCGSAKGMRADLGLQRPTGAGGMVMFEVKTMAFCKSRYHTRCHAHGRSWADVRAQAAVKERHDQGAELDEGLFRGVQPPPMATVMKKLGGVRALVVGGCCELNTTAHELIVEIGSEMGAYNAAESGEDIRQCTALEINRVRQRLAVQIWRDYQEHITARIRYADPDADARTRIAEEMEQEEEEAEQEALVRLYNEAYLRRMGRPQEFGV